MKVLFLHFTGEARDAKAARLAKSGAELIVEEPRWPRFYELARKEKPAAIVIDFSRAPSHALETRSVFSSAVTAIPHASAGTAMRPTSTRPFGVGTSVTTNPGSRTATTTRSRRARMLAG